MMNRRNWFLTAGGILAVVATPTKAYSFLSDNPLRDDAKWLGTAGYVKGGEYILRSEVIIQPGTIIDGASILMSEFGCLCLNAHVENNKIRGLINSSISCIHNDSIRYFDGKSNKLARKII